MSENDCTSEEIAEAKRIGKLVKLYQKKTISTGGKDFMIHIKMNEKVYVPLKAAADKKQLSMSHLIRELAIIYLEAQKND